jgi:hypothetical protein
VKTALLMSGHMRCWEQVFPNTKKHILDVYNPDVFILTWDNEGYWTSPENDPESLGINKNSPKLDVNGVMQAYNPSNISVLRQSSFIKGFLAAGKTWEKISIKIRPQNILSQFFLRVSVYEFFRNIGAEYDQIIFMRPDMEFLQELPKFDFSKMNFINHPNHEGNGYGDMFLATNAEYFDYFSSELACFDQHAEALNRFCPHLITKSIADKLAYRVGAEVEIHNIAKNLQHTPNGQYRDWNAKGL